MKEVSTSSIFFSLLESDDGDNVGGAINPLPNDTDAMVDAGAINCFGTTSVVAVGGFVFAKNECDKQSSTAILLLGSLHNILPRRSANSLLNELGKKLNGLATKRAKFSSFIDVDLHGIYPLHITNRVTPMILYYYP